MLIIERILEGFCQFLRIIIGCLVAALIVPVTMQVLARYTGIIPVYLWTEELSTFIFVWLVMIGATLAVWEGTHFDVHVAPEAKSPLGILIQKGFVLFAIGTFSVLFAYYGVGYAEFGAIQTSVMLQVNLVVINIVVPVCGFCWAVFSLFRFSQLVQNYKHGKLKSHS